MQIAPSNGLEHLIRHFLVYYPSAPDSPMRFFSDGSPGIVIPLAHSALPLLGNRKLEKGEFVAYGLMEHFVNIPPPPVCGTVIIVLQPYTLSLLTGIPSKKLKNSFFSFRDLFGNLTHPIQEAVKESRNLVETIGLLEDFFLRISPPLPATESILNKSLNWMQQSSGNTKIVDLLHYLSISERQLERKFDHYIGISPRKLNGILRINHFLKLLRNPEKPFSLAQAALEAGFYDQAHLNNSFKALTGTSPSKYLTLSDPLAMNLFVQHK
ncbi:helix-turn-helix domain-containing protein [Pedobacter panaciterrae]|uniref:Helix-turn-helix domain-containing protein n=1 Tax=Pedobacter panaciterrae TaxID=363849 RepID=A0ABU8NRQ6_9SPHI|nr:helix-turn-helix domain-containing protein [uncultured Pedobacter sp.]